MLTFYTNMKYFKVLMTGRLFKHEIQNQLAKFTDSDFKQMCFKVDDAKSLFN